MKMSEGFCPRHLNRWVLSGEIQPTQNSELICPFDNGFFKIMVKVFFHMRSPGKRDWTNEPREFSRVPSIGEYVSPESNSEKWFRVELVVHNPFQCPYEADVYAVAENHLEVMVTACGG